MVVAEESYGTGNLECYYKFSDESGNLKKIKSQRETSVTSLSQFFKVKQHISFICVVLYGPSVLIQLDKLILLSIFNIIRSS